MKNKITSLFAFFALVVLISSCSDNSTTTPDTTTTDMFPNTIGNYWINENYSLDTLGAIDMTSKSTDSTIVTGSMQLNGKLATELTTIAKDTTTKNYISKGTNQLFSGADMINGLVGAFTAYISVDPNKLYLDEKWLLVADQSQTSWAIATKNFTNIPFSYNTTMNGTMSGTTVVTGKKGTTLKMTIQGKEYTAQEYIMESNLNSNLSIIIPIGTIKIQNTQHFWLVPGVGLVKQQVDNIVIDMDIPSAKIKQTQKFAGGVSNCIRFKLK